MELTKEQLEAIKSKYEEFSHMLEWYGQDGLDSRTICYTIEDMLKRLGHNLDEIEWIKKW